MKSVGGAKTWVIYIICEKGYITNPGLLYRQYRYLRVNV